MSKEFDELSDRLQRDLQPTAPSAENDANGPASVRETRSEPGAGEPLPGPLAAPTDGPDALATVRCPQCEADVVPTTPNHCPQCGGWVFANTGALVHGLRSKKVKARVESFRLDLLDQLFAERGGRDALDLVSRISVENYALACSQQKIVEAHIDQHGVFTQGGRRRPSYDMLIGLSSSIDRLRAQLPPIVVKRTAPPPGLATTPFSALLRAQDLVSRQARGEQLTDRELGHLDVLRAAIRGDVFLPADPPETLAEFEPSPTMADVPIAAPGASWPVFKSTPDPANAEPEPERNCAFGCGSISRCADLKTNDLSTWRVLHRNDPLEIERRCDEATADMFFMLGRK